MSKEGINMTNKEKEQLSYLLEKLQMTEAPCKGGPCLGHMNCDFGENGCYGESCAIEDVINGIAIKK